MNLARVFIHSSIRGHHSHPSTTNMLLSSVHSLFIAYSTSHFPPPVPSWVPNHLVVLVSSTQNYVYWVGREPCARSHLCRMAVLCVLVALWRAYMDDLDRCSEREGGVVALTSLYQYYCSYQQINVVLIKRMMLVLPGERRKGRCYCGELLISRCPLNIDTKIPENHNILRYQIMHVS
jgi:hypothetical protein